MKIFSLTIVGTQAQRFAFGRFKRKFKVSDQSNLPDSFEIPSIPAIVDITSDSKSLASSLMNMQPKDSSDTEGLKDGTPETISQPKSKMTTAQPFITEKFFTWYAYGVHIGWSLGIHNYHWDNDQHRLLLRHPQSCAFGWWLGTWLIVEYLLFLMVQLLMRIASDDDLDFDKLILIYTIVLVSLPLVFLTVSALHQDVLIDFINHVFGFCYELGEKETVDLKIATVFLQWVYASVGLVVSLWITGSIVMPELCHYLSSLCSDSGSPCYIPLRITSVVIMTPTVLVCAAHCATYLPGLAVIIVMKPTITYLKILHAKRTEYGPEKLLHLYRQLLLIFGELNQLCSMLLFPSIENILVTMTVFGFYGTLRTGGVIRTLLIVSALLAYSCLILLFWALGKIHSSSSQVLASWRHDLRFSKRDLQSVQPIRIRLGCYAHVDDGILLTIMDVIISNSITLLIITT